MANNSLVVILSFYDSTDRRKGKREMQKFEKRGDPKDPPPRGQRAARRPGSEKSIEMHQSPATATSV